MLSSALINPCLASVRDRNAIVLRMHGFQGRECHFLMYPETAIPAPVGSYLGSAPSASATSSASAATAKAQRHVCMRVPVHLRSVHWTQLLGPRLSELNEQLVLPTGRTSMMHTLCKLESPAFIHCYRLRSDVDSNTSTRIGRAAAASLSEGTTLLWELPRFGLELVQRGIEVLSKDYTGYRLAQCQQLVSSAAASAATSVADNGGGPPCCWYTLPEFQQYMVLERVEGLIPSHNSSCARVADTLVLVPVGEVQPAQAAGGGGGLVRVKLSGECDAHLKVRIHTAPDVRVALSSIRAKD